MRARELSRCGLCGAFFRTMRRPLDSVTVATSPHAWCSPSDLSLAVGHGGAARNRCPVAQSQNELLSKIRRGSRFVELAGCEGQIFVEWTAGWLISSARRILLTPDALLVATHWMVCVTCAMSQATMHISTRSSILPV